MRVTIHQSLKAFLCLVCAAAALSGCSPPGARALLDGKRLFEDRKYPQAIEKFRAATALLGTNAPARDRALAWDYLGLALQYNGQGADADKAYRQALWLDRDLIEVRYNLGCLLLEQNNPEAAANEFTAYKMARGNSIEGWLQLGSAQLRLASRLNAQARSHKLAEAEASFQQVRRLSPRNAEAVNGLGLAAALHGRYADAAQDFAAALQQQPGYAPALLNLAIISDQYNHDLRLAVQKYREYLALQPRQPYFDAVKAEAAAVELAMSQPPRPTPTNPPATGQGSPRPGVTPRRT